LSWQVLHEFYANTVGQVRVPQKIARQLVEFLRTPEEFGLP